MLPGRMHKDYEIVEKLRRTTLLLISQNLDSSLVVFPNMNVVPRSTINTNVRTEN